MSGLFDYVCDHCSRRFTRKYNLLTHIENCHTTTSCKCDICVQTFGSPAGLQLHMSRGHNTNNQPLPECDICGRVFKRKQNITSHMLTVHLQGLQRLQMSCPHCDSTFTTERNLRRHINHVHDTNNKLPTCNECNEIFKSKNSLISHIQTAHVPRKEIMKCHLCSKAYNNWRSLKRHMDVSHRDGSPVKCGICPKIYTSNQSLRRHARCHSKVVNSRDSSCGSNASDVETDGIECDLCIQSFETEPQLRQHIKTEHSFDRFYSYCKKYLLNQSKVLKRMFSHCEFCYSKFKMISDLKEHMKANHDIEYVSSTCYVCFKKFYSKEMLTEHKVMCTPPENVNKCSYCDKLFTDISSLEFHVKVFHPQVKIADSNITSTNEIDDPFKCPRCGRNYSTDRSLKHHIKLKHTTNEASICQHCQKVCRNKYYLESHIKMVHNTKISLKCDYCGKTFQSKRNYRRHMDFTHLKVQRYKCIECETLFKEKRSLRKHVRSKHPHSSVFPQCHICRQRFESAKSCKIHLKLIHSFNMNTYPCDLCSISFTSNEALKDHQETKHSSADTGFRCAECNIFFEKDEDLMQHKELHKTNKDPPSCVICSKYFSTRKSLKRHIRKFHVEFDADDLMNFGLQTNELHEIHCENCVASLNDEFHYNLYHKLKHLKEPVIFKCDSCKYSYKSLEYLIYRQKLMSCVGKKSSLVLSELCVAEMSDGSHGATTQVVQEPESTTNEIKVGYYAEMDIKIEPVSP